MKRRDRVRNRGERQVERQRKRRGQTKREEIEGRHRVETDGETKRRDKGERQ